MVEFDIDPGDIDRERRDMLLERAEPHFIDA